jgi:prepilin-type N-terminal cleavage/methylation domain-containing protein
MSSSSKRAGYSLVELMIVVVIIGIGAALAAPGFADARSEQRASRAAFDLIRIGRRARADTAAQLKAHLVWVETNLSGVPNDTRISLVEGTSSSCTNQNWTALLDVAQANGPCGSLNSTCLEQFRFQPVDGNDFASAAIQLRVDVADAVGNPTQPNLAICYAPTGLMFTGQANTLALATAIGTFSSNNTGNGGIRFRLTRRAPDGTQIGVPRWVLFPQGAPPRSSR